VNAAPDAAAGVMSARFDLVVLDCTDPPRLARFYADLLGLQVTRSDDEGWSEVRGPHGAGLAFQLAPGHVPPTWPDATVPQQIHLDIDVADLDAAQELALALGATATGQPPAGTRAATSDSFRVFRDPAGHPFCLCRM
jgi:catechol 2,3-dioxygenase-like lactoylglutathione lyase family enzyme